jgi:chitodextrinase
MKKINVLFLKNSKQFLLLLFGFILSGPLFSQYTLFGSGTPGGAYVSDLQGVEVGVRFKAVINGTVTHIRFYKDASNSGAHAGHLWAANGTLLGTASFSSETSSGWQEAALSSSVNITAGTEYIASYFTTTGYRDTANFFANNNFVNGPLTALKDTITHINGVYSYFASSSFPDSTFHSSNYCVDVKVDFDDATAPSSPGICYSTKTSTTINLKISGATDNLAVSQYVVYNGAAVLGTFDYNPYPDHIYTVTGLTAGHVYSDIKATAKDLDGNESAPSISLSKKTLPANLFFDEGFEGTCPWDPFYTNQDNLGNNGNTWARQQSPDHPNEGLHSFRAEVREGCDGCKSSGFRSEIRPIGVIDTLKMWYGLSVYLKDPDSSGKWSGINGLFLQWHPASDRGSSAMSLLGSGASEGWNLVTNAEDLGILRNHITYDPITTNVWHHLVFYVDWDSVKGHVKGWVDGVQKWDIDSLPWNPAGRYLKIGMNRWGPDTSQVHLCPGCDGNPPPTDSTWIIYYDNIRIGDSTAGYSGVAPVTDTTKPSSFTLSSTNQTINTISLSWTAATDNIAVTNYEIYVNGNYVADTNVLAYILTGLDTCKEYTIYIKAKDAAGNFTNSNTIVVSTKCIPYCATIVSYNALANNEPIDHNLTNVPAGALLVVSLQTETHSQDAFVSSDPELTWTKRVDAEASSSGDAEIWTAVFAAGGDIIVHSNFGFNNQTSVCYVMMNFEPALGGASANASSQPKPDLNITTTRANSIIIGGISDWNAVASGNPRSYRDGSVTEILYNYVSGGFTSYNFYRSAGAATTYREGLSAPNAQSSGTVLYEVRCAGPDSIAPAPPGLCVTGKTHTTLIIDDATAATDNVAVTGYQVYIVGDTSFSVSILSFPYTITGLTSGGSYAIHVRARDASGNISAASASITDSTLAPHILFNEGFEGCSPWSNWSTNQDAGHAWSRQQSDTVANEGTHSFRAEVRSGCDGYVSGGYRSEILPVGITDEGVMWYGLSIYLDKPFSGGNWTGSYEGTILQWNSEAGGSAMMALVGSEGKWNLMTNPGGLYDTRHHNSGINITHGWHHIVFKVDWHHNGYVKVWIDGELMFNLTDAVNSTWFSPEDLDWDAGRYLKVGMTRWGNCNTSGCPSGSQGPCDTWVLYYDNVRIGDSLATYEDVAPVAVLEGSGARKAASEPEKTVTGQEGFSLGQNFPNPVTGQTSIPFTLPQAEKVNLVLFDQHGRSVKVLARGSFGPGKHIVGFNKALLANGIYYYKIQAGKFTKAKKLIIQ